MSFEARCRECGETFEGNPLTATLRYVWYHIVRSRFWR